MQSFILCWRSFSLVQLDRRDDDASTRWRAMCAGQTTRRLANSTHTARGAHSRRHNSQTHGQREWIKKLTYKQWGRLFLLVTRVCAEREKKKSKTSLRAALACVGVVRAGGTLGFYVVCWGCKDYHCASAARGRATKHCTPPIQRAAATRSSIACAARALVVGARLAVVSSKAHAQAAAPLNSIK